MDTLTLILIGIAVLAALLTIQAVVVSVAAKGLRETVRAGLLKTADEVRKRHPELGDIKTELEGIKQRIPSPRKWRPPIKRLEDSFQAVFNDLCEKLEVRLDGDVGHDADDLETAVHGWIEEHLLEEYQTYILANQSFDEIRITVYCEDRFVRVGGMVRQGGACCIQFHEFSTNIEEELEYRAVWAEHDLRHRQFQRNARLY